MKDLDEILDKPVVINFKENSIPSLRSGTLEFACRANLYKAIQKLLIEARIDELRKLPLTSDPLVLEHYNDRIKALTKGSMKL